MGGGCAEKQKGGSMHRYVYRIPQAISQEIEALNCNPGVPRKSPNERKRRLPNGSS